MSLKYLNIAENPRLLYSANTAAFSALVILSGNPDAIVKMPNLTFNYDLRDGEPDYYHSIDCSYATDTVYFTNNLYRTVSSRQPIGNDNTSAVVIVDTGSSSVGFASPEPL
jgi:hypothetical protein